LHGKPAASGADKHGADHKEKHGGDKPAAKKEKKAEAHKEAAPKPAAAAADDGEDDNEFAEENSKDVFAHLPKGTFNMDEFKKVYSNNDTKTVALPWFWKNFDAENYSIWYGEYKYPEELKLVFIELQPRHWYVPASRQDAQACVWQCTRVWTRQQQHYLRRVDLEGTGTGL